MFTAATNPPFYHPPRLTRPQYISLVTAAESLRAVTINIPSEAMVEQGIFHEVLYPSRELTLQLRANCNGLAELSLGNAAKGIEGWRDCWEQVEPLLSRE